MKVYGIYEGGQFLDFPRGLKSWYAWLPQQVLLKFLYSLGCLKKFEKSLLSFKVSIMAAQAKHG